MPITLSDESGLGRGTIHDRRIARGPYTAVILRTARERVGT